MGSEGAGRGVQAWSAKRRAALVFACAAVAALIAASLGAGPAAAGGGAFGGRLFASDLSAAVPTVTGISPKFTSENTETRVAIVGTNLAGATAVDFGSNPASSFTVDSETEITAWSPAVGASVVDVTVTTPGGMSETSPADVFTTQAAPNVEELRPAIGPEGVESFVEILGSGFSSTSAVRFGSVAAKSFTVDSPISITAVAPPGAGSVDVTVTTPKGTSAVSPGDVFAYTQPYVTHLAPSAAAEGGGTHVTLTGTNLDGATAVRFGEQEAESFTVNSANSITAISPPGTGHVQILVVTPHGTGGAAPNAGFFNYEPPPVLSGEEALDVTSDGAELSAEVNSKSLALSGCAFEYGTSSSYGEEVACPGPLEASQSAQRVTVSLASLHPGTEYHVRLVATTESGTTDGSDLAFTTLDPPEYGRCVKALGIGRFSNSACTATQTGTNKYEWYPAFGSAQPLSETHFTTKSKGAGAKLQTVGGSLITCTGQTGAGEYTGNRTIGNLTLTFTNCRDAVLGSCQSSGAATGEVRSVTLTGTLGVVAKGAQGPAKNVIGTAVSPASGATLAAFSCGTTAMTVSGGLVGEVKANGMKLTGPVKFAQSKGVQKPLAFEGGEEDVLVTKRGEAATAERTGLTLTTNVGNEEKIEVDSVF